MNIPHTEFCVLPWISLEASPIGTVRPCCLGLSEIVDDQGTKISLGDTDIDTIRRTQYMVDLRQSFLDGERHPDCNRCWREENAGRTSKRQHTLTRLQHMIDDCDWTTEPGALQFLDLKLGNICNLKCRICGSWSSSTFAAEEIRYQTDRKNNFHYAMIQLGRWPREQMKFWKDLEQRMSAIRYLEFTGGEPFMILEHFDLLRKLVDKGHASNIEIHYNTNGTMYPSAAEDIWRNFRHVEIAFSIDDVEARFEYQRAGADWTSVNAHIKQFHDMKNRNHNITLQVCTTVNVFNVMYLEDVASWIDQQGFDFVYWNMLHDSPQFCVANLPRAAKDLAYQRLQAARFSDRHRQEINRIIEFMRQGTQDLGRQLCSSIRQVDQRRNQNICDIAPELAASIGYCHSEV